MPRTVRVLALALAALLAACTRVGGGSESAGGRHPWTRPGELRVAMSGAPNTLNPIVSTQQVEAFVEGFVFSPLVATDPAGHDVPVLAREVPSTENGGISRDGRTITYHLREGVRWHDGVPFTSRDVAFTIRTILDPNVPATTRHGWDRIVGITTPDPHTVVLRLREPFAPAIHTFFGFSDAPVFVLPAHLLAGKAHLERLPFNSAPIGTGPFRVARWIRGDRVELAANDDYFGGKPGLRRVTIRLVPDENTIVNQVRAREVDLFYQATPRTYPQLRAIADLAIPLVPFNGNDAMMLNTTHPPFDDARVRRAAGLAIDKPRLVRDATFGTAVPATEDLPPQLWAFDRAAGTSRPDEAEAARLLDAAGWRRGPHGVRMREGRPLRIGLAYRTDSITDRERSVIIAAELGRAGFDVDLHGYTTQLLYAPASQGGILAGGRYDAGLQTWYAGVDPDDSSQLLCAERAPAGYNWSRYCSPEMDAAQRDALGHYDRATRTRDYARIEELLARDAPEIYLWWPRQIYGVNPDLRGFRPNGIIDSWNAREWTI